MDPYKGPRLSIEKRMERLSHGKEVERVVVHPGDAVAVLPVRADGCCYLIRQYRYAIGTTICEAPAGTLNAGERPEDAARRELIEETGFQAETLVARGFIYTTPGFTDERIFLFEAHGLSPSCLYQKDDDEEIELVKVPLADLSSLICEGSISDAKTIALVYRCLIR